MVTAKFKEDLIDIGINCDHPSFVIGKMLQEINEQLIVYDIMELLDARTAINELVEHDLVKYIKSRMSEFGGWFNFGTETHIVLEKESIRANINVLDFVGDLPTSLDAVDDNTMFFDNFHHGDNVAFRTHYEPHSLLDAITYSTLPIPPIAQITQINHRGKNIIFATIKEWNTPTFPKSLGLDHIEAHAQIYEEALEYYILHNTKEIYIQSPGRGHTGNDANACKALLMAVCRFLIKHQSNTLNIIIFDNNPSGSDFVDLWTNKSYKNYFEQMISVKNESVSI